MNLGSYIIIITRVQMAEIQSFLSEEGRDAGGRQRKYLLCDTQSCGERWYFTLTTLKKNKKMQEKVSGLF